MVKDLSHWWCCWTIFGLTCVTGFWLFSAIRDLGGHSYLLFAPLAISRPSHAPELGPSPFHWLFEHSLPELVQNEWNATVIGGKGSSLWSRNRGLSLSLSAIRVTENHSMIGQ